eukprot:m.68134 g.68134  ORF g.68134 m.68134 type:complete len:79 (+) comp23916_c0_seq1:125-361(+)
MISYAIYMYLQMKIINNAQYLSIAEAPLAPEARHGFDDVLEFGLAFVECVHVIFLWLPLIHEFETQELRLLLCQRIVQ